MVHDAIREQQVKLGVPGLIAKALVVHLSQNKVVFAGMGSLMFLLPIQTRRRTFAVVIRATTKAVLLPIVKLTVKMVEVRCKQLLSACAGHLHTSEGHRAYCRDT